jgi:endonuclease-3
MNKLPFNVDAAFDILPDAVAQFPKAALFELHDEGYLTPFEILVACIISVRTRDETTLPVARRLFDRARSPLEILALPDEDLEKILSGSAFSAAKAANIRVIARRSVDEYGQQLPCDFAVLTALPGVGPKCANLVLSIACGQQRIGVDIHVHRVTNRWGYVQTTTPEGTLAALEEKLPRRYWVPINRLLVPFGKHICTGTRPHCTTCPLAQMCAQVGITNHQ